MIVYLSNKTPFRADLLSNRIVEIAHELFQGENKLTGTLKKSRISNLFVGESMSRRIPNGSWCPFRKPSDGTRNGKVAIVQRRDIQDPDTGGQYTVKIYRSEKATTEDSWSHRSIHLEPDSMDFNFKPLTLESDTANDLDVVGEFVGIVS